MGLCRIGTSVLWGAPSFNLLTIFGGICWKQNWEPRGTFSLHAFDGIPPQQAAPGTVPGLRGRGGGGTYMDDSGHQLSCVPDVLGRWGAWCGVQTSSPEARKPQPLRSGVLRWPLARHPHLQLIPEATQPYTCACAKWLQLCLTLCGPRTVGAYLPSIHTWWKPLRPPRPVWDTASSAERRGEEKAMYPETWLWAQDPGGQVGSPERGFPQFFQLGHI